MECPQGQEVGTQDVKRQATTYCRLVTLRARFLMSLVMAKSFLV